MESFEEFYNNLVSHEVWYEQMQLQHKGKDIKAAAQKVYGDAIADPVSFKVKDISDHRRHIHYVLFKMPVVPIKQVYQVTEEKNNNSSEPILTGKERDEWIKKWKESLSDKILNSAPRLTHKEIIEEGDWLPKKDKPYIPNVDLNLLNLKECIRRFAARKYKGNYSFNSFKMFTFGLVEVFAENEEDAKDILRKAEKLNRMNQNKPV